MSLHEAQIHRDKLPHTIQSTHTRSLDTNTDSTHEFFFKTFSVRYKFQMDFRYYTRLECVSFSLTQMQSKSWVASHLHWMRGDSAGRVYLGTCEHTIPAR